MNSRQFVVCALLLMSLLATSCGTLQVGIEAVPTAAAPSPSIPTVAAPTATTEPGRPAPTAKPVTTVRPSATPSSSTPVPLPLPPPIRITFSPGSTLYTLTANLTPNRPQTFILEIQANQQLQVTASNSVSITVLDAQGNAVKASAAGPGQWQGRVAASGDYTIILRGSGESFVTISIPPLGS